MMWKVFCKVTAKGEDSFMCKVELEAATIDEAVEQSLAQIKDPWPKDTVITGAMIQIRRL